MELLLHPSPSWCLCEPQASGLDKGARRGSLRGDHGGEEALTQEDSRGTRAALSTGGPLLLRRVLSGKMSHTDR